GGGARVRRQIVSRAGASGARSRTGGERLHLRAAGVGSEAARLRRKTQGAQRAAAGAGGLRSREGEGTRSRAVEKPAGANSSFGNGEDRGGIGGGGGFRERVKMVGTSRCDVPARKAGGRNQLRFANHASRCAADTRRGHRSAMSLPLPFSIRQI